MSNFILGLFKGMSVMFFVMHRAIAAHINKWRCGSENPRKWSERNEK